MAKNYIGIDVSAKNLHISSLHLGKQTYLNIKNEVASIKTWISTLDSNSFCVFEATGVYSRNLEYLFSMGAIGFSKVTPTKIKGFMKATGKLQKTDKHDAANIREFGEKLQPELSKPIGDTDIEKARLEQSLVAFEKQIRSIDNQIHVLDHEPIDISEVRSAYVTIKETILAQKDIIQTKLEKYKSPKQEQAVKLMQTIKGIGPIVSNALATTTSCFEDYDNDKQVAKYFGLAPVEETSGTSVKRYMGINRTAVPHVRVKLFVAATSAIRYNPRSKELYNRLRSKGKPKKVAKVAVMRQLVRWAFAVVKSGMPFREDYLRQEKTA